MLENVVNTELVPVSEHLMKYFATGLLVCPLKPPRSRSYNYPPFHTFLTRKFGKFRFSQKSFIRLSESWESRVHFHDKLIPF